MSVQKIHLEMQLFEGMKFLECRPETIESLQMFALNQMKNAAE